jgi:hypothetical protein
VLLMAGGLSSDAFGRLQRLDGGDDAVAFLEALVARGSSSYTVRTYGLGLEHFLSWAASCGVGLDAVGRGAIVEYVAEFTRGERDGVAVGRAPATVNHRVSVLASFFAFLIERDRLAGQGRWAAAVSPVPAGSSAMAVSMGCRVATRRAGGAAASCAAACRRACRRVPSRTRSRRCSRSRDRGATVRC